VSETLPPHKIRDELLSSLRKTRNGFFTSEAAAAMDKMTDAEKAKAGEVLVNVGIAIRKIENVVLSEIAEQLKSFEPDLIAGAGSLNGALSDLKRFKRVIDAAAALLSLLGRIAKLVGVPLP